MNSIVKVGLLLFVFALCAAAVLRANHARAQQRPGVAKELYSVVSGQLSALRVSDFDSAYRCAGAALQQKFSCRQFEQMIRRDFPLMTRVEHLEFGAVQLVGGAALAEVYLTAPDREVRGFLYSFRAERDGWKINGVQPLRQKPLRQLSDVHI